MTANQPTRASTTTELAIATAEGVIFRLPLASPASRLYAMGLDTAIVLGLVNGIVITRFKVFPFIATLAMMSIVAGLALSLSGGVAVTGVPEAFSSLAYVRVFGIPIPVVISLAVLVVCIVVLRYTKLGRRIYASDEHGRPLPLSATPKFDHSRAGLARVARPREPRLAATAAGQRLAGTLYRHTTGRNAKRRHQKITHPLPRLCQRLS